MRYFLDTEYDGWGGSLLSVGLAAEHGEDYYVVLPFAGSLSAWVELHVRPYLWTVPEPMLNDLDPVAAAHDVARYLSTDPDPEIVADWPEDIALFCRLLVTGNGEIVDIGRLRFEFLRLPGFSVAANSRVPHNALHDARALRDHVLSLEA